MQGGQRASTGGLVGMPLRIFMRDWKLREQRDRLTLLLADVGIRSLQNVLGFPVTYFGENDLGGKE